MPFDFKKYDQKCLGLTPEELQREWQHYTRLISGAATSTTVSGLAIPLTAGVSMIGVGMAAPAIHNARKKREIIERHLQRHGTTHQTRKRDVLGSMAFSGTVGVVTLGVGSMGADAIAAQGAEHGITAIVENETAIKVVTHAALDGAAMGLEHAHTSHLKAKDAHKAFAAAGTFQAVADAKAREAGYAVQPGQPYNTQMYMYGPGSSSGQQVQQGQPGQQYGYADPNWVPPPPSYAASTTPAMAAAAYPTDSKAAFTYGPAAAQAQPYSVAAVPGQQQQQYVAYQYGVAQTQEQAYQQAGPAASTAPQNATGQTYDPRVLYPVAGATSAQYLEASQQQQSLGATAQPQEPVQQGLVQTQAAQVAAPPTPVPQTPAPPYQPATYGVYDTKSMMSSLPEVTPAPGQQQQQQQPAPQEWNANATVAKLEEQADQRQRTQSVSQQSIQNFDPSLAQTAQPAVTASPETIIHAPTPTHSYSGYSGEPTPASQGEQPQSADQQVTQPPAQQPTQQQPQASVQTSSQQVQTQQQSPQAQYQQYPTAPQPQQTCTAQYAAQLTATPAPVQPQHTGQYQYSGVSPPPQQQQQQQYVTPAQQQRAVIYQYGPQPTSTQHYATAIQPQQTGTSQYSTQAQQPTTSYPVQSYTLAPAYQQPTTAQQYTPAATPATTGSTTYQQSQVTQQMSIPPPPPGPTPSVTTTTQATPNYDAQQPQPYFQYQYGPTPPASAQNTGASYIAPQQTVQQAPTQPQAHPQYYQTQQQYTPQTYGLQQQPQQQAQHQYPQTQGQLPFTPPYSPPISVQHSNSGYFPPQTTNATVQNTYTYQ